MILKVFIHMFWGRYVVYNSLVYNDQLTKLWPWGMPENRRPPQDCQENCRTHRRTLRYWQQNRRITLYVYFSC